MKIVFACDRAYAQHLAVSLCSLFENNRDDDLEVYLLNSDFSGKAWKRLNSLAKKYQRRLIDLKVTDEEFGRLVTTFHYTRGMYYRLLIPEKLDAAKALYLDADIVVNGSLREMYDTDLSGYCLAAVLNPGFDRHEELGMSKDAKYFNSGVMLLNLPEMRRSQIKEKVIQAIAANPSAFPFPDQCGLNSAVNGRWKELDPKYNLQGCFFEDGGAEYFRLFPDGVVASACKYPAIIHFSGSGKPWRTTYKHPYRKLYWRYLRMTPFRRLLPSDFTIGKIAGWCMRKIFRPSTSL